MDPYASAIAPLSCSGTAVDSIALRTPTRTFERGDVINVDVRRAARRDALAQPALARTNAA